MASKATTKVSESSTIEPSGGVSVISLEYVFKSKCIAIVTCCFCVALIVGSFLAGFFVSRSTLNPDDSSLMPDQVQL